MKMKDPKFGYHYLWLIPVYYLWMITELLLSIVDSVKGRVMKEYKPNSLVEAATLFSQAMSINDPIEKAKLKKQIETEYGVKPSLSVIGVKQPVERIELKYLSDKNKIKALENMKEFFASGKVDYIVCLDSHDEKVERFRQNIDREIRFYKTPKVLRWTILLYRYVASLPEKFSNTISKYRKTKEERQSQKLINQAIKAAKSIKSIDYSDPTVIKVLKEIKGRSQTETMESREKTAEEDVKNAGTICVTEGSIISFGDPKAIETLEEREKDTLDKE
jgi:hypothetical protein